MSVGETLARARRDAGLSIAEISIRTGVRRSVIEGIEHDDFSACGGDYSALAAIAALARVLRADSAALVQAYDAAWQPGERIAAAAPPWPASPAQAAGAAPPAQVSPPAQEPGPVTAGQDTDTLPIVMGQPPELVTGGAPASSSTTGEPPPITAGGAFTTAFAVRRQVMWIALWTVLIAFTGLGGILVLMGASGQAAPHGAATGPNRAAGNGATRLARTRQPSPGHSASPPGHARLASPASRRSVRVLVPASIAAFGPGGTRHGDSPQLARHALTGKAAAPWHSAWYASPRFGNLQSGTGLLVDMGRTVTIASARIALGNRRGADLTLRIGNSPALASLRPVAHAYHAGGVVRLATTPARGRFVLVWFTRLPPGQAGTFQVYVYGITLRGYP